MITIMNKSLRIGSIFLAAAFISSCAAGLNISRHTKPQSDLMSLPSLNVFTKAELGDAMLTTGHLIKYDAIRLVQSIEQEFTVSGKFKITIPTDSVLTSYGELDAKNLNGKKYGGVLYLYEGMSVHNIALDRDYPKVGGVLISDNEQINNALWYSYAGFGGSAIYPVPIGNVDYKKEKKLDWETTRLRQELVYNGVSGSKINFIYREFEKDKIRDKFTQEASYDLSNGNIVGFKGARFEIIKADNTEIQYKLLQYFK